LREIGVARVRVMFTTTPLLAAVVSAITTPRRGGIEHRLTTLLTAGIARCSGW
jgi:hypothetical protein